MNNAAKDLMVQQFSDLKSAAEALQYSYDRCIPFEIETGLDHETMEKFEALTARFARLSDILIQKVFRTLDTLDLEAQGTVRDRINRAEKRGVIESAEDFVDIRMIRNEISHEYNTGTLLEIFERVLSLTPTLLQSVEGVESYSQKYLR